MKDSVHTSKIDSWLIGVFAVSGLMAGGACLPVLRTESWPALVVVLVTLAFALGLPSWLIVSTRYTLTDEELRIRSGPFRWTIALRSIRRVTPTRNPLSSPALSLDRLRIDYDGRSIMISPLYRGRFVDELKERGVRLE
ncbi:MAG TPA: PH domain-containing protein [Candidatus Binatia bacterium]